MTRRLKMLTGLSTLALTSALALGGCGGEGEGEAAEGERAAPPAAIGPGGESEGEAASGEGEGASGGESEGAAARSGDPATDDIEYFYRLGLVRGHLAAFIELYRAGATDMAGPHAKHPESELYAALAPAMAARGSSGFAGELTALAEAAASGGDVETAYSQATAAIAAHAPALSVSDRLVAISNIAKTAGDEFAIGVDAGGAIVNAHEYQDAYGFLTAARDYLSAASTNDINESEAIAVAHEQLDIALAAFSGLMVEQTDGRASALYGAAARIEIAGLGLR